MAVVVAVGFLVVILPREPQVHGDGALALDDDACRPKRFARCLPACVSVFRRGQLRRAQMIRVQVVVLGLCVCQAVTLLCCCGGDMA